MRAKLPKASVRRALYSIIAVILAEIVGTVGIHAIERVGWVDAFYFESMLATGQGPPFALQTDTGKVFASFMAYVSVGSVLSAVVFTVGPVLLKLWREALQATEDEARRLEQAVAHSVHGLEERLEGPASDPKPPHRAPPP